MIDAASHDSCAHEKPIRYSWHWASCIRRLVPLYLQGNPIYEHDWEEERKLSPKFHFRYEYDYEIVENLLLDDLSEMFANYTMLNIYTRSLMVTLKLALQSGYGIETSDSVLNMLMSTFLMFGGWIYAAYVLVLVSNVLLASANSKTKFEEISRELDAYCAAKGLSKSLTRKIKTFYKYKFHDQYFNEDAINESTTINLRKEIMMHSCSHLVAKVPIFKDIPKPLLENIISCLKLEIYFPDDIIIHANTVGDAMYFIAFGTASIYSSAGKTRRSAEVELT